MLFNVAHIHRPDLLPEPGLTWHLQLWTRRRRRLFLDAREFATLGQEPSTGRLGEMDANLRKPQPARGTPPAKAYLAPASPPHRFRACHCGISSRRLWPNKAHRLSTSYSRWRGVCKEALIAVLDH